MMRLDAPPQSTAVLRPRSQQRPRAVAAVLALAVLCGQCSLVVGRNFSSVLETPFLPYCLLGAFAIHFWTRPARAERIATLLLAAAYTLAFLFDSGRYRFDWPTSIACGSFFGLASLTVLAVQTMRLTGVRQKEKLETLVAGSAFGYSALFIAYILNLTTRLHPRTFDLYLYAADAGFGIPICAWMGRLVNGQPLLLQCCSLVYESLPLAVSLLYAYQRSGSKKLPVRVLPAFLGGGAAAYLLYNVLPATGPHYIFGAAFPDRMPAAAQAGVHLVTVGDVARNAVPSMHLACALMIFWACRPLGRLAQAAAAAFLALTILATLGFGEHYVVDLIAGVPYALALLSICSAPHPGRRFAIVIGIALTLAWIVLLRFAVPLFESTIFTWAAALSTLAICAVAKRRLRPSV